MVDHKGEFPRLTTHSLRSGRVAPAGVSMMARQLAMISAVITQGGSTDEGITRILSAPRSGPWPGASHIEGTIEGPLSPGRRRGSSSSNSPGTAAGEGDGEAFGPSKLPGCAAQD